MSSFTSSLSTDAWNRPAVNLDTDIGQIGVLDPADVRRGQLTVCERAVDAAEARMLLAMLGIGAEPGRSDRTTVRTEANRRRACGSGCEGRVVSRWNGRTEPRTQDHVADRYTLTVSGFVATLPRGECGHIICAGRDRCAWLTTGGRHRGVTSTEERT